MEDTALLAKIIFFKDLTQDELLEINNIAVKVSFRQGQKVFDEGSEGEAFYVVKNGSVMIKSKNIVVATLGAGEPIGEMSFIDKGPRSASVTAIENTELLKVSSDSFQKLLERETGMAAKVYKAVATILCRRLRETEGVIGTKFQPVKY